MNAIRKLLAAVATLVATQACLLGSGCCHPWIRRSACDGDLCPTPPPTVDALAAPGAVVR
jgi:hypothetical protein